MVHFATYSVKKLQTYCESEYSTQFLAFIKSNELTLVNLINTILLTHWKDLHLDKLLKINWMPVPVDEVNKKCQVYVSSVNKFVSGHKVSQCLLWF